MRPTIPVIGAVIALVLASTAHSAPAPTRANNKFFDWTQNATPTPTANFIQSPFLNDADAADVNVFLSSLPAGSIRAVKIESPISTATAKLIFNNPTYNVSYIFADIETPTAYLDAQKLAKQIRPLRSGRAFISNFGAPDKGTLNMTSSVLYPGSPALTNPANGNSTAPSIRSAFVTVPITRLSQATTHERAGDSNVPWITNFNNFGNASLNDASGTGGFGYYWSNPTADQMLSARDFATLVAHYRLRGADSFNLFPSGELNTTQADLRSQAVEGWTEPHINALMSAKDHVMLIKNPSKPRYGVGTMKDNTLITIDGVTESIESSGAVWSGVYSMSQQKLDFLLTNMTDLSHTLTLPSKIASKTVTTTNYDVPAGSSLLVEFSLNPDPLKPTRRIWQQTALIDPFTDLSIDRSSAGVPEPTTTLPLFALALLFLNRRGATR